MTGEASPERAAARRSGYPFLVWPGPAGREHVLSLPDTWQSITVGRGMSCDLILAGDDDASRVHAELRRMGEDWVLIDEGLSRNGSFVNGVKVGGRQRLVDGDALRFGKTTVEFHAPLQVSDDTRSITRFDAEIPEPPTPEPS